MLQDPTKYRQRPILSLTKKSGQIGRKEAEDIFWEKDLYTLKDEGSPLDKAVLRYAAQFLRDGPDNSNGNRHMSHLQDILRCE